jgi:hypothetical protein
MTGLSQYVNDSTLIKYFKAKEMGGRILLPVIANEFEKGNPDYNNYITKTVVLIELFVY